MADETSHMFITGPDVIKTVTGEDVDMEELGGGRAHNTRSGVAHYLADDEADALSYVRDLLSYLPSNNLSEPPSFAAPEPVAGSIEDSVTDTDRELDTLVPPDSPNTPPTTSARSSPGSWTRASSSRSRSCSRPTSCAASPASRQQRRHRGQPATQFAGCLDIHASEKAARFVRTCDAFNVPVVTFVDVPGFLPGTEQEWNGIIRRGAKLIYAYAEATVPQGHGHHAQGLRRRLRRHGLQAPGCRRQHRVADGQIAVTGASGGRWASCTASSSRAWRATSSPSGARSCRPSTRTPSPTPYIAADRGYIDAVVPPSHTRGYVGRALRMLSTKREEVPTRKHGNIPL